MKILPLIPILFLFFSCKEEKSSSENDKCKGRYDIYVKGDYDFHGEKYKTSEMYMIQSTDSWTYSSVVVFEKYNELDYRLKTTFFKEDTFKTERKLSKGEWNNIKSTFDSFDFWCFNPEWSKIVVDGFEVRFTGIKDSKLHYIPVYRGEEKDSALKNNQIFLRKTALNLMNIGGLEIPQKPKIVYHKMEHKKIGIEVYSPNHNFSKLFEVYLDNKKILKKDGVAEIIILESDLGKFKLKVKEILINDVELSFEATLNQYLLDINKINK
jgi:hypothetical protein